MATQSSFTRFVAALLITFLAGGVAWTKYLHAKAARPSMYDLMYGVYLRGNNIESDLAADANSEEQCSNVCREDTRCKAMSFVQHPWGGGVCQLKDRVPEPTPATDAVSAVKYQPWRMFGRDRSMSISKPGK
jgi:PAN domain